MSKDCIILSSDEEVQIIDDVKIIHERQVNLFENSKLANTLKKLSGNKNIQLSINIDHIETKEEKENSISKWKNGFNSTEYNKTVTSNNFNERIKADTYYRSESPEVYIIDEDTSKPNVQKISYLKPIKKNHETNKKTVTSVVTNPEEIFVIDDNSESSDDDCTILSTSIAYPEQDPLLIKRVLPENCDEEKSSKKLQSTVDISLKSSQLFKYTLANNGKAINKIRIEDKENSSVNSSNAKSREVSRFNNVTTKTNTVKQPYQRAESSISSSSRNNVNKATFSSTPTILHEESNKHEKPTFDDLVKVCDEVFQDETFSNRLRRYYKETPEDMIKSEDFSKAVQTAVLSSKSNMSQSAKFIFSSNVKEVIRLLKRQPARDNKKLRKLNRMLSKINERIKKLEEMEVTSDEDEEDNIYIVLDRHRTRATKIYNKICELEGKVAHAGRAFLQKFNFSGTSQYPKIEHALEKYFNKTRVFPDFFEVKKLIESTVEKEKYHISPSDLHTIAQSIFVEFGDKLQRRRQYDDYTSLVDYLEDGCEDPAWIDTELKLKLEKNKSNRKKESEVLEEFTRKQVECKSKEVDEVRIINSDEDIADEDDEEEEGEDARKKSVPYTDTEEELLVGEEDAYGAKRLREVEKVSLENDSKRRKTIDDNKGGSVGNPSSCP